MSWGAPPKICGKCPDVGINNAIQLSDARSGKMSMIVSTMSEWMVLITAMCLNNHQQHRLNSPLLSFESDWHNQTLASEQYFSKVTSFHSMVSLGCLSQGENFINDYFYLACFDLWPYIFNNFLDNLCLVFFSPATQASPCATRGSHSKVCNYYV
jgi:hypothetical protein